MTDKMIRKLAGEMRAAMVQEVRQDTSVFYTLRDDAPEWCHDVVREAHGDMLPDDHRFALIASALGAIADGRASDDEYHSWCDSQVDVYTPRLIQWLASHADRVYYCDQAVEDGLVSETAGIVDRLGAGQYAEAAETFGLLWDALRERAEEIESEDAEEQA